MSLSRFLPILRERVMARVAARVADVAIAATPDTQSQRDIPLER